MKIKTQESSVNEGLQLRKYKNIATEKLKPYANNARTHSENQIEKIAKSIEEFGFVNPVLVDQNLGIIAGHGRVKAAELLGLADVPCLFIEDLTETQKRAYIIADNKLALDAGWDFEKLKIEIEDLKNLDFDINLTGFSLDELDFAESETIEDDDFEEELPEEPKTKLGEIYKLGNHRLMCGDSTNSDDVQKLMNGETANLLVTDPPYNVAYEGKTDDALKIQNDSMSEEKFVEFLTLAFKNADKYLKNGGSFYIWYGANSSLQFFSACEETGWQTRQQLIWVKNGMCFGRQDYQWIHEPCIYGWKSGGSHYFIDDRTQTTILEFNKQFTNAEHPTMKSISMIAKLIENSSKRDEIVMDIFGGSGTTLIACEQLDRRCFMMELDPRYCDVIINRWENLTGEKAVKIN